MGYWLTISEQQWKKLREDDVRSFIILPKSVDDLLSKVLAERWASHKALPAVVKLNWVEGICSINLMKTFLLLHDEISVYYLASHVTNWKVSKMENVLPEGQHKSVYLVTKISWLIFFKLSKST